MIVGITLLDVHICTCAKFFPSLFPTSTSLLHHLLISIRTYATVLIIESTVDIWTVVEGTISLLHWSSPSLVHEVPMETCERSVLVTLVLQKSFALLHTKLLQVPYRPGGVAWCMCIGRRTIDTLASSKFISIEAKTRGNHRAVSLATAM